MSISDQLLEILICPESKQALRRAEAGLIDDINHKIERGSQRSRNGALVANKIDGGLIREDDRVLYIIRNDVPVMLVDDSLALK